MNNQQLHRKQIMMLVIAMALAIGSLWIPLPQQAEHQEENPVASKPGGRSTLIEPMTVAREPATAPRFPVVVIPQTVVPADLMTERKANTDDARLPQPPFGKLDSHDLANGDKIKLGNPSFAPIKDFDHPSGR